MPDTAEQFHDTCLAIAHIDQRLRQISRVDDDQRVHLLYLPSSDLWGSIEAVERAIKTGTLWGHTAIIGLEFADACYDALRERDEWPGLVEELIGRRVSVPATPTADKRRIGAVAT